MSTATTRGRIDGAKGILLVVTAIFLVLGIALEALMIAYWIMVLEPRLKTEAVSQAEILARSQGGVLAHALLTGSGSTESHAT